MKRAIRPFLCVLTLSCLVLSSTKVSAFTIDDPTGGTPFVPWLWDDQLQPTIATAVDTTGLSVLAAGIAATVTSHQYDPDVRDSYGDNRRMPPSLTRWGAVVGSGMPGISIAVIQLFVDQKNGLQHARSLLLTSATAITIASIAERERPNHSDHLSFPSGHTSSAFTTATTLAYEYGWWVGVPAYALSSFVAASRIADNDHWFSDTVAAAALGIFWARASANAPVLSGPHHGSLASYSLSPVYVPGGALVSFTKSF